LRPAGAEHPPGRAGPGRVRPVRGAGAGRHLDRGRPARPAGRRPQGLPVRVPGRSLTGRDGGPLGLLRGQRAAGRRAAPGAGRPHGETGQPPIDRWLAGGPFPVPEPARLREAFLWSEARLVRKDATVRLFGGAYETDPALAGRKVECVFDPFDLTVVEIRWNGAPCGLAVPRKIGRHSHPRARPEEPGSPPPATGIDYL